MKPYSTRQDMGKAIKGFAFCTARGAGERGIFDSILNLKYFV
jgi:hypothetical protein